MGTEKKSYEQSLDELTKLVGKIKDPDNTLEETIRLYEEGMTRYRDCCRIIEEAKQTVAVFDAAEGEEA